MLTQELLASLGEGALKPAGVDLLAFGHRVEELDQVAPTPWLDAAHAFMTGDPR